MRNKLKLIGVITATIAIVSLSAAPVFAEDSTSTLQQRLEQEREDAIQKVKDARKTHEQNRVKSLQMVAQNQINRAQNELDRLDNVLTRLKALRVKINASDATSTAGATATSTDLAKIDDMISKAEALKTKIVGEIADAKAKQAAMASVLPKVDSSIEQTTTTTTPVLNTAAPTPIVTSVKDFQSSIKQIKKDLITLHKSLQDISKAMRKATHVNQSDADKKTTNTTSTTDSGDKENQ